MDGGIKQPFPPQLFLLLYNQSGLKVNEFILVVVEKVHCIGI